MADICDDRALTRAHLSRAAGMIVDEDLNTFRESFDHNELELAADVLCKLGSEHGEQPRAFWEALGHAYYHLNLPTKVVVCRFRIYEAEHGYVEARLTLLDTREGGRERPICTDYRPGWNIGTGSATGALEIHGAAITLEDRASLQPGETGIVRLHPLWRDAWRQLVPGARIDMHEGSRVLGTGTVTRVTLRHEPARR